MQTLIQEQVDVIEELVDIKSLIIHNDDINTFEWVIESLMDICKHELVQAEQCTMLIHFKGKAAVKNGTFEELQPMKDAFSDRGINATID